VPGTISREEADEIEESDRIKIIRRDSLYIVKVEVLPQKWFILQSYRTANYENYTSWHMVFKESMD
jgi:hypothetical protein